MPDLLMSHSKKRKKKKNIFGPHFQFIEALYAVRHVLTLRFDWKFDAYSIEKNN